MYICISLSIYTYISIYIYIYARIPPYKYILHIVCMHVNIYIYTHGPPPSYRHYYFDYCYQHYDMCPHPSLCPHKTSMPIPLLLPSLCGRSSPNGRAGPPLGLLRVADLLGLGLLAATFPVSSADLVNSVPGAEGTLFVKGTFIATNQEVIDSKGPTIGIQYLMYHRI